MRYLVNSSVPDHHMTSFKEATHLSLFRIYTDVIGEIVQAHVLIENQMFGFGEVDCYCRTRVPISLRNRYQLISIQTK